MQSAQIVKVIATMSEEGDGIESPIRIVYKYWSLEGSLLATNDVASNDEDFDIIKGNDKRLFSGRKL